VESPDDKFYKVFGAKLATARQDANFTQAELASKIGLSRTSVTNIEKGRQPVQLYLVARISQVLDLEISDLLPAKETLEKMEPRAKLDKLAPEKRRWVETVMGAPTSTLEELKHDTKKQLGKKESPRTTEGRRRR
jgi:transcriptional regulator with XRE-family HTH domain